jgi:hypothetical protein
MHSQALNEHLRSEDEKYSLDSKEEKPSEEKNAEDNNFIDSPSRQREECTYSSLFCELAKSLLIGTILNGGTTMLVFSTGENATSAELKERAIFLSYLFIISAIAAAVVIACLTCPRHEYRMLTRAVLSLMAFVGIEMLNRVPELPFGVSVALGTAATVMTTAIAGCFSLWRRAPEQRNGDSVTIEIMDEKKEEKSEEKSPTDYFRL